MALTCIHSIYYELRNICSKESYFLGRKKGGGTIFQYLNILKLAQDLECLQV